MNSPLCVGVLGGMGPLATVDFLHKLITATPATCDQDHIPVIVYSDPRIPNRDAAIASECDDPLEPLIQGIRCLERAGVDFVVIPCNTAHAWFDRIHAATGLHILHIGEAVRQYLTEAPETLAIMATAGTVKAKIYAPYLTSPTRRVIEPDTDTQALVTASIDSVKAGQLPQAKVLAERAVIALSRQGADRILLACTELPIALSSSSFLDCCLDATLCLAHATIQLALKTK